MASKEHTSQNNIEATAFSRCLFKERVSLNEAERFGAF